MKKLLIAGLIIACSALPGRTYVHPDTRYVLSMSKGQVESTAIIASIVAVLAGLNGMRSDNHNEIARNGVLFGAGVSALVFIPIYFEF
jgi:cytosine/uracil/thiamine/allantoin permease